LGKSEQALYYFRLVSRIDPDVPAENWASAC
jgi:hypothetical protein